MTMKKVISLFLASAMLCGLLGACGESSTTAPAAPSDEATSSGAANTEATTDGTPAGSNSITVGIAQDLDSSLDPYLITAAGTREVLFNVFEGLVKPDSTGAFVPAVASEFEVSPDGLTYTFTLRDGVKFHNGADVTMDDVLYSFNTCAATTVQESLAAALSACVVEAQDNTLTITLENASTSFLSFLAYVYIVPADYADQATAPVGTGPFKFVSRSVQENVILEKHADYYGTPAYVDQVTYRVYEDATAMITALDAHQIDLCAHLSIDQIAGLDSSYEVLEGTMNLVQALYLNNAVEPFNNELVRQALCYAIDIQGIMDLTEDGHGTKIGSAMYPNFTKYFDPALSETYTYDVDKAKELLTEAGYADGFSFTITVPSNYTPHMNTAEVIVEQLKAVGITATINPVEWDTWLSDVYAGRNYETTVIGFDASTLTADAMLSRYRSDASNNMFNYANPEYDETYAKAVAASNDTEATALYKECLSILNKTAANVYIQDMAEFVVINANLTGYEFYPLYVMDMSTIQYK